MNPTHGTSGVTPGDVARLLRDHYRLWLVPMLLGAVLAAGYTLFAARSWRASQALIVRAEAAGIGPHRLGKFTDLSEMKTLQETILELARSQGVITAALQQVGPPRGYRRRSQWPTPQEVDDFRGQVKLTPPGGAEFGKTEVFYLAVLDKDSTRASALVSAMCGELENQMRQVRNARAQSMIAELENTARLTEQDLAERTRELATFEGRIGADLAELRNLISPVGGSSGVNEEVRAIETERRQNESLRRENEQLVGVLTAAGQDPEQLLAMPASLLRSQPALSRLKNALVDAQVRLSTHLGSRTEHHPDVINAREAQSMIRSQLHHELVIAIKGLQVDLQLNQERERQLSQRADACRRRLAGLAGVRAEYSVLTSAVDDHTRIVESARKNLADARASRAGARSASLIARIDGVETGTRPVGLGRSTVTLAGGVGGLLLGLGLVFLVQSPATNGPQPVGHAVDVGVAPAVQVGSTYAQEGSFGMFRGMKLSDAIRHVEDRIGGQG